VISNPYGPFPRKAGTAGDDDRSRDADLENGFQMLV
jgi:hypothetical protein